MTQSFEELVRTVDATWSFSNGRYHCYPTHPVSKQEFEIQHCANHIGTAAGKIHAELEKIDHEGVDMGNAIALFDGVAKLMTAAIKLSQVLQIAPDDLAKAILRDAE